MMTCEFERRVINAFAGLKCGHEKLEFCGDNFPPMELVPFTENCVNNSEHIARLARWRRENIKAFPKVFEVTETGTQVWARKALCECPDRILFYVRAANGELIGHVGLSEFDYNNKTCEIYNIVRGQHGIGKGLMSAAIYHMMQWTYDTLIPSEIRLKVLHENTRAIAIYHRLGFVPLALEPLKKSSTADKIEWVPANENDQIDRFYLVMRHVSRALAT